MHSLRPNGVVPELRKCALLARRLDLCGALQSPLERRADRVAEASAGAGARGAKQSEERFRRHDGFGGVEMERLKR